MQIGDARPASEEMLTALEQQIGESLPVAYRRFLLEHGGGRPSPNSFEYDSGRGGATIRRFFSARPDSDWGILRVAESFAGRLAAGVLPIAEDGCGNLVCIGLAAFNFGRVFFWDHEQEGLGVAALLDVSEQFDQFLESLHEVHVDRLYSAEIFEDVANGASEAVARFLTAGGNPNVADQHGRTLIANAAMYGHVELIRRLASAGARLEGALPIAAQNGQRRAVSLLLELGARVDEPENSDERQRSPLFLAAIYGHRRCVELLLAQGANARCRDSRGVTIEEELRRLRKDEMLDLVLAQP